MGDAVLIPTRVPHLCDMSGDCRYSTLRSHGFSWVKTAAVTRMNEHPTLHLLRFTLFNPLENFLSTDIRGILASRQCIAQVVLLMLDEAEIFLGESLLGSSESIQHTSSIDNVGIHIKCQS